MTEAKIRKHRALYHAHVLIEVVSLLATVVSGHRHERAQKLTQRKLLEGNAQINLVVKFDLVKSQLQLMAQPLVVNEGFLRQEVKILLKRLLDHVNWQLFQKTSSVLVAPPELTRQHR